VDVNDKNIGSEHFSVLGKKREYNHYDCYQPSTLCVKRNIIKLNVVHRLRKSYNYFYSV